MLTQTPEVWLYNPTDRSRSNSYQAKNQLGMLTQTPEVCLHKHPRTKLAELDIKSIQRTNTIATTSALLSFDRKSTQLRQFK